MFIADTNKLISFNTFSYLISKRYGSKKYVFTPTIAKKKDISENKPIFPLKIGNNKIIFQSAIGVLALGFIDAGYSGDWSRIGVISRETEDLLKVAAFLVVPLGLFLIFSLSKKHEE